MNGRYRKGKVLTFTADLPLLYLKRVRMVLLWSLAVLLFLGVALLLYFRFAERIGSDPRGERLARIQASPNYKDGKFQNLMATNMDMPPAKMLSTMWEFIRGGEGREPRTVIPTVAFDVARWDAVPDSAIAVAWFGHSTLLLKVGGVTILTDPVFGERASTFSFAGPKRFAYDMHMTTARLPKVDVVLLSHDHYDHLDHATVLELRSKVDRWVMPLGVGAHLEAWGVPAAQISEHDWWEQVVVQGVELTLTPTRHFSGRGLTNRFSTLWGAWVLRSGAKRVYFGADSGPHDTFAEIGRRFGPFDLVLLECGAYNDNWADIHMRPEETAAAARDLGAKVLMPIHWAKFSLAMHPWKEPVERVMRSASDLGIPLLTPRIGRIVNGPDMNLSERWWETVE
jgi:L-ascorbate metabolism protein UlaG (beta-lactamase superfamily)